MVDFNAPATPRNPVDPAEAALIDAATAGEQPEGADGRINDPVPANAADAARAHNANSATAAVNPTGEDETEREPEFDPALVEDDDEEDDESA
jgi:hypothetical protein